jgi:hypothetical protein
MNQVKLEHLSSKNDNQYFWMISNENLQTKVMQYHNNEYTPNAYFGDNQLWCHEDNNQAMDKYDIFGPLLPPERMIENSKKERKINE